MDLGIYCQLGGWGGVGGWVSGGSQIPQIQNGDGDGGDGFTRVYEGPAFRGPPPPRVLPDKASDREKMGNGSAHKGNPFTHRNP